MRIYLAVIAFSFLLRFCDAPFIVPHFMKLFFCIVKYTLTLLISSIGAGQNIASCFISSHLASILIEVNCLS